MLRTRGKQERAYLPLSSGSLQTQSSSNSMRSCNSFPRARNRRKKSRQTSERQIKSGCDGERGASPNRMWPKPGSIQTRQTSGWCHLQGRERPRTTKNKGWESSSHMEKCQNMPDGATLESTYFSLLTLKGARGDWPRWRH